MNAQIVYAFETGQAANRFLNRLKSGDMPKVKARLHKGSNTVQVSYSLSENQGYDSTCAELDDLAASMDGVEVSHS
ncbi:hypothetical protein [Pseudomaricurvus sp.]|uniref:hypothetical protein n=1 Tax=Pseudomaricurvus sp. TaxID=2004510 RepID=UPI003F6B8F35